MSPLGVVTDGVTSTHSEIVNFNTLLRILRTQAKMKLPDPLWDGAILLHLLCKLLLDTEGLQGGHCICKQSNGLVG